MEWLNGLPLVAQILVWVAAVNVGMSGLKAALDMIKDKTASQVDNKAAEWIGKICAFLGKALDAVGYNPAHRD